MRACRSFIAAGAVVAGVLAWASPAASQGCTSEGRHGVWRYSCAAGSCTLRPSSVVTENQHGRVEEDRFPFSFILGASPRIAIGTPPDATADRLDITYSGDVLASADADARGGFSISDGKTFVALGHALQGGKRLVLVFKDRAQDMITAVAAIGHEGFDRSFQDALVALDAAAAGECQ